MQLIMTAKIVVLGWGLMCLNIFSMQRQRMYIEIRQFVIGGHSFFPLLSFFSFSRYLHCPAMFQINHYTSLSVLFNPFFF
jgi:hypothetical protein